VGLVAADVRAPAYRAEEALPHTKENVASAHASSPHKPEDERERRRKPRRPRASPKHNDGRWELRSRTIAPARGEPDIGLRKSFGRALAFEHRHLRTAARSDVGRLEHRQLIGLSAKLLVRITSARKRRDRQHVDERQKVDMVAGLSSPAA